MMQKNCEQCSEQFEILEEDLKFYDQVSPLFDGKKFSVPTPRMCPSCRHQRRLAFRNERKLYTRKCDLTGKQIISIYSPDKPYKVYDQEIWWSDKWEGLEYGREFDFSRNFAEQFRELYVDVPRVSLHTINVENSYYTCYTLNMKNCYLIFGAGNDEDCMYGKYIAYSNDCLDSLCVYSSRFSYECTACDDCYGCRFALNCRNCSDSTMLEDCSGCKNCIACFGLRNKEYCIMNEFVGKEKYEEIFKEYEYLTGDKIAYLRGKLEGLKKGLSHIQSHIYASEECSGEAIYNSKNCAECFDIKGCEDCKYVYNSPKSVSTYDAVYSAPDGIQFSYGICSSVGSSLMSTFFVWYCDNVYYSMDCQNSKDLFGCVGLRNKQFCIFNKQYSKEEYGRRVAEIIAHMQETGEWGEYLPYSLSPFAYNETVAMEYFPLDEGSIKSLGAKYRVMEDDRVAEKDAFVPPDDIRQVDEKICNEILRCEITGRQYKIMPAELKFYQRMKVPIPRRCPDQRHFDRLKVHGFYKTTPDNCKKCGIDIKTIQDSSFDILCEDCYLKEIY